MENTSKENIVVATVVSLDRILTETLKDMRFC